MRGFLVRRRLERERAAAVTIQRAVRAHQERRRQAAVAAVKRQMAEMAELMREYQRRTASALRIQVRGLGGGPSAASGLAWRISSAVIVWVLLACSGT